MQDQMTTPAAQPIGTYCALMEEVKSRIAVVRHFTDGRLTLGREDFNAEALCIHLRKILEAIAFGSLVAHRHAYESAHNDVESRWRAKQLLKRIEAIHPNFYPMPVTPTQINGKWHFEKSAADFLTQTYFETLYDKCSEMMHLWNPFRAGPRVVDFGHSLDKWCDLIENLLRHHVVWLHTETEQRVCMDRVPMSGEGWVVYLSHPDDGKTHAFRFEPVADRYPTAECRLAATYPFST